MRSFAVIRPSPSDDPVMNIRAFAVPPFSDNLPGGGFSTLPRDQSGTINGQVKQTSAVHTMLAAAWPHTDSRYMFLLLERGRELTKRPSRKTSGINLERSHELLFEVAKRAGPHAACFFNNKGGVGKTEKLRS